MRLSEYDQKIYQSQVKDLYMVTGLTSQEEMYTLRYTFTSKSTCNKAISEMISTPESNTNNKITNLNIIPFHKRDYIVALTRLSRYSNLSNISITSCWPTKVLTKRTDPDQTASEEAV